MMLALITMSCYERVDPANEGILVTNYGQNYPDDYAPVSGRVNVWGFGRDLYQVPMFEQKNDVEPFYVYASNGGTYTVDPKYTFSAIRGQGTALLWKYSKYRNNAEFLQAIADNLMDVRIYDRYKDIAGLYSTDSLMNNRRAYEQQVKDSLIVDFRKAGFTLQTLASGLQPPPSMVQAVEKRNAAVLIAEQKENERAAAEAQQKIDESNAASKVRIAEYEQKEMALRGRALSPELIQEMMIQKWDGKLGKYSLDDVIQMFKQAAR